MVVCPTCSWSKQVMSLVTTSTTALRGAATSLELAERRRGLGSTLSTRFLLCTARRSVDRLQTKVRAQSDGLAARNHSRWVHFRKISSADAEKRRGKTKKYHRQGGGTRGGGILPKRRLSQPALFPVAKPGHSGRAKWQSKWQTPDYGPTTCPDACTRICYQEFASWKLLFGKWKMQKGYPAHRSTAHLSTYPYKLWYTMYTWVYTLIYTNILLVWAYLRYLLPGIR